MVSFKFYKYLVYVLIIELLYGFYVINAKTVSGKFQLTAGDFTHGPEYEITKYSFAIGQSVVEGTITYRASGSWMTSPALYLFMDENWDKYHKTPACMDKVAFADAAIEIGEHTRSHQSMLKGVQVATSSARILKDGRTEWKFKWTVEHTSRTHGWFLVAADCALEQYNSQVSPMEYEIKLLNPGNTHLPADEHGLPKFYLADFILMTVYFVYLGTTLYKQHVHTRQVHLVVLLLVGAYGFQYMSIVYELIHLFAYRYNGYGVFFCDFISEIFEGLSQSMIAFTLICLASGWTLVDTDYDKSKAHSIGTLLHDPSKMLQGGNLLIFIMIAFMLLSFALQILNKSFDDHFQKFHDYESRPGMLLVLLRFSLGLFFVYSFHVTIKIQENRGGDKLLAFLKRLRLLGGLWFLSFPIIVFCAGFFAHYNRHFVVSTGVLTIQTIVLSTLGYQFISESSTYFKLSTLADSGVLPGAGGLVRAPKASRD